MGMLVIAAPVMAAIALAIRIEPEGPVLVRATRVGRGGRPFHMLKYRSALIGAKGRTDRWGEQRRVTRVGALLRRASLDELPQLFNVIAAR